LSASRRELGIEDASDLGVQSNDSPLQRLYSEFGKRVSFLLKVRWEEKEKGVKSGVKEKKSGEGKRHNIRGKFEAAFGSIKSTLTAE